MQCGNTSSRLLSEVLSVVREHKDCAEVIEMKDALTAGAEGCGRQRAGRCIRGRYGSRV